MNLIELLLFSFVNVIQIDILLRISERVIFRIVWIILRWFRCKIVNIHENIYGEFLLLAVSLNTLIFFFGSIETLVKMEKEPVASEEASKCDAKEEKLEAEDDVEKKKEEKAGA